MTQRQVPPENDLPPTSLTEDLQRAARDAATQAPPPGRPPVEWAAPSAPIERPVPGAPGFSFADTPSRVVAYVVDYLILGILGFVVGGIAGEGTTTVSRSASSFSAVYAVAGPISTIALFVLSGVYFVMSWTSRGRATPGQRLFHMQVGNAFDGRTLTVNQAIRRWLAFGWFIGLLGMVPGVTAVAGLVQLAWYVALLYSTATSATRQGPHDRFANAAVVRPSGLRTSNLAFACAVVIGLIVVAIIAGIVLLAVVGPRMFDELSRIGRSV